MVKNERKKIINGAISLTVSSMIVKLLGLAYKIPLSYILSDEGMSYFNSAYTVYTFFYIISTAGVPRAISILTANANERGSLREVREIYKTAFSLFLIIGTLISILFFILSVPLSKVIGNQNSALTMMAVAPSILFVCASGVLRGYFNGTLNLIPISVSEIISGVGRLGLGLIFAYLTHLQNLPLYIVSAATIMGSTIGAGLGFLYLLIHKKIINSHNNIKQNIKIKAFPLKLSREILRVAIPLTLTSAIGAISGVIDLSLIMRSLLQSGATELQASILYGNYTTLVIPMINLVAALIAPASAILLPLISSESARCDTKILSERLSIACRILVIVSIPISVLFFFNSKSILAIIFEDAGAGIAAPLLSLTAPGITFMCISTVINTTLEGIGEARLSLVSLIISSVTKLVLTYVLVTNPSFEILGAPISSAISYFVGFLVSYYFIVFRKRCHINCLDTLTFSLISSFIAISLSECISKGFANETTLTSLFELSLFGIFYLLFSGLFGFKKCLKWLKMSKYTKKT